ncbi:MAG: riboflavin synthase [Planctomycetes bacterium]|nr:riboflavin synthase [Planctomycetota bacterium]
MFTGIIEAMGRVRAVRRTKAGARLEIDLPFEARRGESVAVGGVCLTWVGAGFDVVPETLSRTTLGALKPGDRVNLERSLRVGDRLGGHFVTGHVDAVGEVARVLRAKKAVTLWVSIPVELARYVVPKGSITIDGVSLTVVDAEPDRFSVALIPVTLAHTTLGRVRGGAKVNLEVDILARYVRRGSGITKGFLRRAGFVTAPR